MFYQILITTILLLGPAANATPLIDQHFVQTLEPGARVGLHGMAIFGNGQYYLAHIPMHHMPHDIQLVAQVELTSINQPLDFSKSTFTVRPNSTFSLNNMAKLEPGKNFVFTGSIHQGSFEMGGTIVTGLDDVEFKITKLKVVRPLPSDIAIESVVLSDSHSEFEVNLITPSRNFQKIINLAEQTTLWCVLGPDFFEFCPAEN